MGARLIAEIGADVSGFERGINKADMLVTKFGHDVSKKLANAFGAGMLAAVIAQVPAKFIEQAEKIKEGAAKLKVSTDEYQMLSAAAKDAGMETEEFVKANAKNGVMLDVLVKKLGDYRGQIEMTKQSISTWTEIGQGGKSFLSGLMGPIGWGIQKTFSGIGAGLNLGGAVMSSLGFGNFLGVAPEDYLLEARKHAANLFGYPSAPSSADSSALPLPAGYGQTKKLNRLEENLRILGIQEGQLKQQAGSRASFYGPSLTDREEGGAFVARQSVIVQEQQETNDRLEAVRKEISDTKEEIRKLREGG